VVLMHVCDIIQPMTPNSFGTHNNVITVRDSDFEAFEALGMDSIQTGHHSDNYYVKYGISSIMLHILITTTTTLCTDAVGWVAGRASGL